MTYADINKRFTEIVAEYIGKGYTINSATMGGSQGERAKIDLTDGNEIIRILFNDFYDYGEGYTDGMEIIIGRSLGDAKPHSSSDMDRIWNHKLEVLACERFHTIGISRKNGVFYGTEDEAKAAGKLRTERYIARNSGRKIENITGKSMEIAKRIIRRKFGYERVRGADISVSKCNGAYIIEYKNRTIRLH